jgi:hypothetical protein
MSFGVMVYKGNVYLPKKILYGFNTSSTYIWVESGDFKDCLFMPYSDRSSSLAIQMRDSLQSVDKYRLININVNEPCGILIFPNGDIVHLVFSKKNNKPLRIVSNTVLTFEHVLNNGYLARFSGCGIETESVCHLMTNNESVENIFKYLNTANISIEDFFVFNIQDWKRYYDQYRNIQTHFHLS